MSFKVMLCDWSFREKNRYASNSSRSRRSRERMKRECDDSVNVATATKGDPRKRMSSTCSSIGKFDYQGAWWGIVIGLE